MVTWQPSLTGGFPPGSPVSSGFSNFLQHKEHTNIGATKKAL